MFAYMASDMQKQLAEEALHDKLTGLHNRFYMNDRLERIAKGDYVLRTVASLLQDPGSETEVCRWGGEEFLFVGEIGPGMEAVTEWLDGIRCGRVKLAIDYYQVRMYYLTKIFF